MFAILSIVDGTDTARLETMKADSKALDEEIVRGVGERGEVFRYGPIVATPAKQEEVIKAIQRHFRQPANTYYITYTGHGVRGNGNWAGGSISFELISRLLPRRARVFIFADCCFSGHWAYAALEHDNINVAASCEKEETSKWGNPHSQYTSIFARTRPPCEAYSSYARAMAHDEVNELHGQHPVVKTFGRIVPNAFPVLGDTQDYAAQRYRDAAGRVVGISSYRLSPYPGRR